VVRIRWLSVTALVGSVAAASPLSVWETDPAKLCEPITARIEQGEANLSGALEECRAEAASRLAERQAAAPSLGREELAAIPQPLRIEEERRRLEELDGIDRALADRAEGEARRRDVHWMRPALSVAYCVYAEMKAQALSRLGRARAKEKSELSRQAKDYQRSMNTIALSLRAWATTPTACQTPLTAQIRGCLQGANLHGGCTEEIRRYVALVPAIYP
jgi:hypothetical protein